MLLSNLTSNPVVCEMLLLLKIKVVRHSSLPNGIYAPSSHCATSQSQTVPPGTNSKDERAMPLLLDAFLHSASAKPSSDLEKNADLHYLASVFANISTVSLCPLYYIFTYGYGRYQPGVHSGPLH